MLANTEYKISDGQLVTAQQSVNEFSTKKVSLNAPTNDFFYDPWTIKPEYKNTIWEEILSTIPEHGEARIIKLAEGECYTIHADIDDRWHLNISGENSYLVDLLSKTMYPTIHHNSWFLMNAGNLHSAVNFGNKDRYQLVVRKLLDRNIIADGIEVTMQNANVYRYHFDQIYSPWLNYASKEGIIANFKFDGSTVSFTIEKSYLGEIINLDKLFLSQVGISLIQL
jgi:hypothetical protein